MKMRSIKIALAGLVVIFSSLSLIAQTETDALRFSMTQPQGTARSIGFGNALGSVGGDFSTLSVNPAGLGIYRKSEFTLTPSLNFNNVSSSYLGGTQFANGNHFSFSNLGIVWTTAPKGRRYQKSKWKAVSVAFGFNRTADFTHDYSYRGNNTSSSASFVFESDAVYNSGNIGLTYRPAYLGYQSYLLDTITNRQGNLTYKSIVDPSSANPVNQHNIVKERGGITEITLSLGGNYKEKLMVGGTIGLPVLNYSRDQSFTETNITGVGEFNNFTYNQRLTTSGIGANFKLGAIYKINDYFRVGAAVHTPTIYSLTDVSDANVIASRKTYGTNVATATQQQYDYSMSTPWHAIASATAMLGSFGFFTVDYEYVDYRTTKYHFSSDDRDYQNLVNDNIKSSYTGTSNVRAGLEARINKTFMVRGGFGYLGNPYKSTVFSDGQRLDFSGGLGFRLHDYFADLGFVHHQYKQSEQAYNANYTNVVNPVANLNTGKNNVVFTLGWKF